MEDMTIAITTGIFIVALINLVVAIIDVLNKK
ncbi:putative holin-like toxin [Salinibacillus aidingensis]